MKAIDSWQFSSGFPSARLARLSEHRSFDDVIFLIEQSIQAIEVIVDIGRDKGLETCIQPIFNLTISPDAFDAFFNAPAGYRAQYLKHPSVGLAGNFALVEALAERLVVTAKVLRFPELESFDVKKSLLAASCKVWVDEDYFPFQSPSADLAIGRWEAAAKNGHQKAVWRLCAPTGTRIQVKGALVDVWGNEVVPARKIHRRFEIHDYGFT